MRRQQQVNATVSRGTFLDHPGVTTTGPVYYLGAVAWGAQARLSARVYRTSKSRSRSA